MKSPTYFNRWRRYPRSCFGHTLQGYCIGTVMLAPAMAALQMPDMAAAVAVALMLAPLSLFGFVMALAYMGYQMGSGARKAVNRHETDSIGWDIADMSVGMWLSLVVAVTVTKFTM